DSQVSAPERRHGTLVLLCSLFFISGFSALIYQVVWQRLLTLYYGVGPISTAIVISAFLCGIGVGGLAGGRIVESIAKRVSVYVAIELAIGVFGFASI